MQFDFEFTNAFHHAMLYEVGYHWNPKDPDVIAGTIVTRDQRKKVGYVNIPQDTGGETKYGIAQRPNPEIRVKDLNLDEAMDVYYRKYWLAGACDKLRYPLSIIHFDGCVNHGVGRACVFLQRAAGMAESQQDGKIGPASLKAINDKPLQDIILEISTIRRFFYENIVRRNASQKIFLKGWMTRINEVTAYTIKNLNKVLVA